jgi:hypothetical protein
MRFTAGLLNASCWKNFDHRPNKPGLGDQGKKFDIIIINYFHRFLKKPLI